MEKLELTDFIGNKLGVGDYIVIADCTYSKTPYLVTGLIKRIEEIQDKKGNIFKYRIYYLRIRTSRDTALGYTKDPENFPDPDDEDNWRNYTVSKNSFLNILKL